MLLKENAGVGSTFKNGKRKMENGKIGRGLERVDELYVNPVVDSLS